VESHEAINGTGPAAVFQQDVSNRIQGFVTLAAGLDENAESASLAGDSGSCTFKLIGVATTQTLVRNLGHRFRRPTTPI